MPPDPPTWAADAAVAAFGGASAPPLQNYFLRLCTFLRKGSVSLFKSDLALAMGEGGRVSLQLVYMQ